MRVAAMMDRLLSLFGTQHDPLMLLFIGCTEGLMVMYAFRQLLHRNSRSRLQYAAAMAVYVAVTVFDAYNNFMIYYVMVICYLLITVISLLFYDDPYEVRLLVPFIFVAINYSATIISTTAVYALSGAVPGTYPQNLRMDYVSQLLLCVIFFLFISFFKLMRRKNIQDSPAFFMILFTLCPLVMLIIILVLFYMGERPELPSSFTAYSMTIAAMLLVVALTLYAMSNITAKMHGAIDRSASLEQLISVQERYYLTTNEHQKQLQRMGHDIKSHNRAIHGLIAQGKYREALEYSETLIQDAEFVTPVTECNNVLIGSMLNDRFGKIKQEGVKISLCVMVPQRLTIKDSDMCILLGNLFDNAVEACRHDTVNADKFIDVDIRLKGPMLCISVKNSFSGQVKLRGGEYLTTKPESRSHGIGLSNVRRTAEKYGGRLFVSHTARVFSASAVMFYPDSPAEG